jgi:hypothetical protein
MTTTTRTDVYLCPHCGQPQPTPPPAPFRRTLVFAVGLEMLLLAANELADLYRLIASGMPAIASVPIILGLWGTAYLTYLWISFLIIGSLRLPGCEFTAIIHVVSGKKVHRCVDSVLNSALDLRQEERGLSLELMGTESAQKWVLGVILLGVFLVFVVSHAVSARDNSLLIGLFTFIYFVYDKSIHRVSIGRRDLIGSGDYTRIILDMLSKALRQK